MVQYYQPSIIRVDDLAVVYSMAVARNQSPKLHALDEEPSPACGKAVVYCRSSTMPLLSAKPWWRGSVTPLSRRSLSTEALVRQAPTLKHWGGFCSVAVARCGTLEVTVHEKAAADPREQPVQKGDSRPGGITEGHNCTRVPATFGGYTPIGSCV
jgi:hypothetical protein